MDFFIRHTNVLEISQADAMDMFRDRIVGIHYGSDYVEHPQELLDPNFYDQRSALTAMRNLTDLAKTGGYIWSDYSSISKSLIGRVNPNSEVFLKEFTATKNQQHFSKNKLFMKCIQLRDAQEVEINEHLAMRARRPRQGTLVRWWKSRGNIEKIIRGKTSVESWGDLSPDQQEILVYEYLRKTREDEYHIEHLLMPIGRTLKDIDIYGVNRSEKQVFVQVTNSSEVRHKVEALKQYPGLLIYAGEVNSRFENGIKFLNVDDVFDFFKADSLLLRTMSL